MQLSLNDKLEFLWQDFIVVVEKGVAEGKYVEGFKNNFQELTKADVKTIKEGTMPRLRSKDELFLGKIVLTLRDVAVLLDAGLDDCIEGDYSGFVTMLQKYVEDQDANVFNQVNVSMFEMAGSFYMPYLNEKGKQMFQENPEKYKDVIPVNVLSSPYYYDFINFQLDWDNTSSFNGEVPSKDDIINKVIVSENERLRDIALLMLNVDNLKIIGFDKFL